MQLTFNQALIEQFEFTQKTANSAAEVARLYEPIIGITYREMLHFMQQPMYLNPYGEPFRLNGYEFPENFGLRAESFVPFMKNVLLLCDTLPVSQGHIADILRYSLRENDIAFFYEGQEGSCVIPLKEINSILSTKNISPVLGEDLKTVQDCLCDIVVEQNFDSLDDYEDGVEPSSEQILFAVKGLRAYRAIS